MSKKTYLFILLVTMMVAVLSVSLTSCSSSDDDNDSKTLKIGSQSMVVDVLSSGTLKLKYYYTSDEYILATYKKINGSDNH